MARYKSAASGERELREKQRYGAKVRSAQNGFARMTAMFWAGDMALARVMSHLAKRERDNASRRAADRAVAASPERQSTIIPAGQ